MSSAEKELENQLLEIGNRILSPPSAVEELFALLDQAESFLSRIEQSPSQSVSSALGPLMNAVVAKDLLGHSDIDVKVAVASCISEITRITAPDAPYDDDLMKEIFQMIVEAFEKLDDKSSRSYSKRVSILETVAKVRSCVVMLDLQCDALILEMFHHFLKTVRSDHPENVFFSMETIMTLVIEEDEDLSSAFLWCLLGSVKKDNKDVMPIAHRLGEKVISNCSVKLKPYMVELFQSTGTPLSDYSKIVASICQENTDTPDTNDLNAVGECLAEDSKLSERTVSDELPQGSGKLEPEAGCPEEVDTAADNSPRPVVNGTVEIANGDSMVEPTSPKQKHERSRRNDQSKNTVSATSAEPDNLNSQVIKPDILSDQSTKKTRGRKTNSLQLAEASDHSQIDSDREAAAVPSRRKGRSKETDSSQSEASGKEAEVTVPLKHEEKTELHPPARSDNETAFVASPTPNEILPTRPKRGRPSRSKITAKREGVNVVAEHLGTDSSQSEASGKEAEVTVPLKHEEKTELHPLAGSDNETVFVASPTPNESLPDATRPKRGRPSRSKITAKRDGVNVVAEQPTSSGQKEALVADQTEDKAVPLKEINSKKESEVVSDPEGKVLKRLGKKVYAQNNDGGKPSKDLHTKKEVDGINDSKAKPLRQAGKKASTRKVMKGESSGEQQKSEIKLQKGKFALEKDVVGEPDMKISEMPHHGKDLDGALVGSTIEVWWPDDKKFYAGVVDLFDPISKKHKIVYNDGDMELLLLVNEHWKFVEDNSKTCGSGVQAKDGPIPDASSEGPRKKKAKTSPDSLLKQAKTDAPLKSGGTSMGKSQDGDTKSRDDSAKPKGRRGGRVSSLGASNDDTPKTSNKSKEKTAVKKKRGTPRTTTEEHDNKTKDETPFSSKSQDATPKTGKKSKKGTPKSKAKNDSLKTSSKLKDGILKNVDTSKDSTPETGSMSKDDTVITGRKSKKDTPQTVTKSKEEAPKAGTKRKGSNTAPSRRGGKSVANGASMKAKSKVQRSEDSTAKVHSGTTKAEESEPRSGKKRRRGA